MRPAARHVSTGGYGAGLGLRPHQPGADPVLTILLREGRNGARSAAPVPRTAAGRCRRTRPGPRSPRRLARGPCPPRDPAIAPVLRKCAAGRSSFLTYGQDPLDHLRSRREPARRRGAKDAHDYRRPGHLPHERSALADRPSPTPVRAIPLCRHDSAIPRSLAVWAAGLFRSRASSTAQRPGCGHLGLPSGGRRRYPRRGPRESGRTPAPRVGRGCPAVRGQPPDSKSALHAKLGQRVRLSRRRTHAPARLCVLGGPALPPQTGSLRLRPPPRDAPRQEAWHGRA
jgi:hypothetical protein